MRNRLRLWRLRSSTGDPGGIIESESKGLRTRGADAVNLCLRTGGEMQCPSSSSEAGGNGANSFSLHLCSVWAFSGLDGTHPHPSILEKAVYFTESTNSNDNLFQKHRHRHTQKQCLIWASHGESSGPIKLTSPLPTMLGLWTLSHITISPKQMLCLLFRMMQATSRKERECDES